MEKTAPERLREYLDDATDDLREIDGTNIISCDRDELDKLIRAARIEWIEDVLVELVKQESIRLNLNNMDSFIRAYKNELQG